MTIGEVGETAAYLVSNMAAGMTGEILHVDAGYHVVGMKNPEAPDPQPRQGLIARCEALLALPYILIAAHEKGAGLTRPEAYSLDGAAVVAGLLGALAPGLAPRQPAACSACTRDRCGGRSERLSRPQAGPGQDRSPSSRSVTCTGTR